MKKKRMIMKILKKKGGSREKGGGGNEIHAPCACGIIITFKAERSEKDAHCEKLRFYIRPTNILFICNFTLSELNIVNLTNIYLTVYMYKKT